MKPEGGSRPEPRPAGPPYWFPAKRYGWGWGPPQRWQGWVVLAAYVAFVTLVAVLWPPPRHMLGFGTGVAAATLVLLVVCWFKGEPPGWRWGK